MNTIRIAILGLMSLLAPIASAAEPDSIAPDSIERALSEVRDVKADLFSRQSSVLGTLPGPAEMAAHQMRCRPIPRPKAGVSREIRFDAATRSRAAALDPVALRKAKGRMGMRVLPPALVCRAARPVRRKYRRQRLGRRLSAHESMRILFVDRRFVGLARDPAHG